MRIERNPEAGLCLKRNGRPHENGHDGMGEMMVK